MVFLATIEQLGDQVIARVFVGADVNDEIWIGIKILGQLSDDLRQGLLPFIERIVTRVGDLNGADIAFIQFLFGLAAVGQVHIDTLLQQRRGDDEDDEQHEREVEERSDIDITQRDQRVALGKSSQDAGCKLRVEG